jgi:hypothetical protein
MDPLVKAHSQGKVAVMKTAVLVGVCGLFILFGISAGVDSVGEVRAGLRRLDWPIAQGEIIRSEPHNRIKRLKRFEYCYTVVGQEFTSARAAFVRVPYFRSLHRVYRPGGGGALRSGQSGRSGAGTRRADAGNIGRGTGGAAVVRSRGRRSVLWADPAVTRLENDEIGSKRDGFRLLDTCVQS